MNSVVARLLNYGYKMSRSFGLLVQVQHDFVSLKLFGIIWELFALNILETWSQVGNSVGSFANAFV